MIYLAYKWGGGYSKSEVDALLNDYIPKSGGGVIDGSLMPSADNSYDLGSSSKKFKGLYSSYLYGSSPIALQLFCGTSTSDGSYIQVGHTWIKLGMVNDVAYLNLASDGVAGYKGTRFIPINDNSTNLGLSSNRWQTVYAATGTINTSDSRLKNSVKDIDNKLLDAWETIQPKQYKFNDATESKGDTARFHTGYIAQDIQKACTDNNLDISKYGLFCYDSWEEEPEITEDVEVEKDGVKTTEKRIIQSKKEKGDIYALRYEEALIVECAYLRREVSKLKQQNENFEQRLKMLEQSVK